MAFNKRTWKGRQGTGLNKFSINGATPVTVINQPDSVTEQGDALSAGNLNDLEDRIYDAFDDIADGTQVVGKAIADASGNVITTTYATKSELTSEATARANADSNLLSAIRKDEARITNLEEKADPTGAYKTVNYRGTNDVPPNKAKYALVESIVGKSRAWNQLADIATGSAVGKWHEYNYSTSVTADTANDKIIVKSRGSLGRDVMCRIATIGVSHAFLFSATLKNNYTDREIKANIYKISSSSGSVVSYTISANSQIDVSIVINSNLSDSITQLGVLFGDQSGLGAESTISCDIIKPVIRDLTVIFPEGVPSTVAECVQKCPDILTYDAYGTSIVDTTVEGVKAVGVNIWDEEWEEGALISDGSVMTNTYSNRRTTSFIRIDPNTAYFQTSPAGAYNGRIAFYDYNKNLVLFDNNGIPQTGIYISPQGAYYMRVTLGSSYGTTYNHDIQICLNSYADKTTYHPYMTDTLTLPTPVTLRSAGSGVNEVQDTLDVESGDVSVKISDEQSISISEIYVRGTNPNCDFAIFTVPSAWLSPKAFTGEKVVPSSVGFDDVSDVGKLIVYDTGSRKMAISIPKNTDLATAKATYNGTKYVYALVTGSTTNIGAVIDNTIQTEGGGTIETIQNNVYPDDSPAPTIDNSMDVGYLAL